MTVRAQKPPRRPLFLLYLGLLLASLSACCSWYERYNRQPCTPVTSGAAGASSGQGVLPPLPAGKGASEGQSSLAIQRVFLVGSGHSGTSVLLRTVGNLPGMMCWTKESYLFIYNDANNETARPRIKRALERYSKKAKSLGYQGWVEKTPNHIFNLEQILEFSPKARVIAIFRDGRDTIASFVKRTYKFEKAVDKWVMTVQAIQPFLNDERVLIIRFEDFVDPTKVLGVLRRTASHLGIQASDERLVLALQPATRPLGNQEKCTEYPSEEDKVEDLAASNIMQLAAKVGPQQKHKYSSEDVGMIRAWQVSQAWAPVAPRWQQDLTAEQQRWLQENATFGQFMSVLGYKF